jgi:hypothetical protein
MLVREYRDGDLPELRRIHAAQDFSYEFPDLENPLFVSKVVLAEDDGGSVLGAALLRLTAEAYLLLDPRSGTPHERWQRVQILQHATEQDAWRRGLEDVHAWLPPRVAKRFGKRIERLGWVRDDSWRPYWKRV